MHYGEMVDNWCLWTTNYHQMVSVLLRLVTNLSPLSVEEPQWYLAKVKDQVREDDSSDEGLKNKEQKKLKSVRKRKALKKEMAQLKVTIGLVCYPIIMKTVTKNKMQGVAWNIKQFERCVNVKTLFNSFRIKTKSWSK